MSRPALLPALAASLLCATMLAGCLTPHVKPVPSRAAAEAEKRAGLRASGCAAGDLGSVSPVEMDFAFDDATVTEMGQRRLAAAARWLACNPATPVVILPDADNHGDPRHLDDLAQRRALAAQAQLRSLGATGVVHLLARGAADPVSGAHLVIDAKGRGW